VFPASQTSALSAGRQCRGKGGNAAASEGPIVAESAMAAAAATIASTHSSVGIESAGLSGSANAMPAKIPAEPIATAFAFPPATPATAFSSNGCAIATKICPTSAVVYVSPSRTAPPAAVNHAPSSNVGRNARRSAIPAGMASTT
jgi:hypothetical protein